MRISAAVLLATLALSPEGRAASDRLVLAIDDRSGAVKARAGIEALLTAALTNKGYEVVAGAEVEAFVGELGVPHAEAMANAAAAQVQEHFHAAHLLAVTVRFLLPPADRGKGPRASPAAGLTARAFAGARPLWRNSLALIDDRLEPAPRDARQRKPLAALAVSKLVWSFPNGSGPVVAEAQEFEDGTDAASRVREISIPDYDVRIARMRSAWTGPRFRLKMRRR